MSASLPKNARWTGPEIARLRRAFPIMTATELAAAFPRHPLGSIKSTAYLLGLHKAEDYGSRKWREIAACHVPVFGFGRSPC
jgi:hypothetical protein